LRAARAINGQLPTEFWKSDQCPRFEQICDRRAKISTTGTVVTCRVQREEEKEGKGK
jgi:hypothetical protein